MEFAVEEFGSGMMSGSILEVRRELIGLGFFRSILLGVMLELE